MSKSIAPNELTKDELIEYLSGRKKHTTPVQRRSRRHFEEELCFFEERMARWMGCGENGRVGSNTDFADLFHPEDQETVMMIHHSLVWLRDEYSRRLWNREGDKGYIPHDYRPKVEAVRNHLLDRHNNGDITITKSQSKQLGITDEFATRSFA